jgi:hypothetical protein
MILFVDQQSLKNFAYREVANLGDKVPESDALEKLRVKRRKLRKLRLQCWQKAFM